MSGRRVKQFNRLARIERNSGQACTGRELRRRYYRATPADRRVILAHANQFCPVRGYIHEGEV